MLTAALRGFFQLMAGSISLTRMCSIVDDEKNDALDRHALHYQTAAQPPSSAYPSVAWACNWGSI
jgi:hypothetical protein